MLEQLINLVKENAGDAIIKNPAIPNQKNDAAIKATAASILNSLKGQMSGGNANGITDLIKGGNVANNPMVANITQQVSAQLMKKFGLDNSAAASVVGSLIPAVMSQLSKKTMDPNDNSFTLDGVMNGLSGGGGILGALKGLFK